MNLKSRTVVALSWTLVTAIILGLASCDDSSSSHEEKLTKKDISSIISSKTDQRTARKYLELDDLNAAYESPIVAGSEVLGLFSEDKRQKNGKKFTYRAKRQTQLSNQQQQQQQQQRARAARQKQQQQKQRPGFLWTIARVTYESFNDTKSAISQIREIISNNIEPEQPKKKVTTKRPVSVTAGAASTNKTTGAITLSTTTTQQPETNTEEEFKLTVPVLQSLVRRNVKGLVRLFNIEWKDAMSESAKSVKEFRSELGKQVGMYLQDNPDKY